MKKLNKKQKEQLYLDIADQIGENREYIGYEKKSIKDVMVWDLNQLKRSFEIGDKNGFNRNFKLILKGIETCFQKGVLCNQNALVKKK